MLLRFGNCNMEMGMTAEQHAVIAPGEMATAPGEEPFRDDR